MDARFKIFNWKEKENARLPNTYGARLYIVYTVQCILYTYLNTVYKICAIRVRKIIVEAYEYNNINVYYKPLIEMIIKVNLISNIKYLSATAETCIFVSVIFVIVCESEFSGS